MNRALGHFCAQDEWDDTPDTGFEVWSRARYLSVQHNTEFDGEETFLFFFKPPRPGNEPQTGVKGNGAKHYPRAILMNYKVHFGILLCKAKIYYMLTVSPRTDVHALIRENWLF